MLSCPLLFVQYILGSSQYLETPRRFTTWGRAVICLQETLKTFRSRKGNCIASDVILRNIYRILQGNSEFTSFLIYVTISRKSALTVTPDCLRTDINITVIGGTTVLVCRLLSPSHSRFCIYWITFTRIPSNILYLQISPTSCLLLTREMPQTVLPLRVLLCSDSQHINPLTPNDPYLVVPHR